MIKALGILVFTLIGVAGIFLGVKMNEPVLWQMGGVVVFVVFLMVVLVKVFHRFFNSKEQGDEAMRVIKRTVKVAVKQGAD
jgi:uncharacterized membrane protein